MESNKENILLVLKESMRLGKEVNFIYPKLYEKHRDISYIDRLTTTIEKKISLFENLDENSYAFQRILDTAKLALSKLQQSEEYNYYSAELIWKFYQLEDFFKKRLKSIGMRVVDQKEKEIDYRNNKQYEMINKLIDEDEDEIIPLTKDAKFINGTTTGRKFNSKIQKEKQISNILKDSNLE